MRELCLNILDLVQNSLEAGATCVSVYIQEDILNDRLTIRVSDNGRGMDAELVKQVADPFVTSRRTRHVGLGLPLVAMWAERSGGKLTINSTLGVGTVVEAIYQYSHWDRPPLGNITDTVRTIIVANPDLQFSYCHQYGGRTFSLLTSELVTTLGDIPLTHPIVLEWLREYLQSGLANLYGGVNI